MSDDRNALHVEQMDGFTLPPPEGPPITVFDMISAATAAEGENARELSPAEAAVPVAVPLPDPTEQPAPVAAPAEQEVK